MVAAVALVALALLHPLFNAIPQSLLLVMDGLRGSGHRGLRVLLVLLVAELVQQPLPQGLLVVLLRMMTMRMMLVVLVAHKEVLNPLDKTRLMMLVSMMLRLGRLVMVGPVVMRRTMMMSRTRGRRHYQRAMVVTMMTTMMMMVTRGEGRHNSRGNSHGWSNNHRRCTGRVSRSVVMVMDGLAR